MRQRSVFSVVAVLVSNKEKRSLVDIPHRAHVQLCSDVIINLSPPVTPGESFRERTQRHLLNSTKNCWRCKRLKWPVRLYLHIPNTTSLPTGYNVLCPSFVVNNILNGNCSEGRHFREALQNFFLKYCWNRLGIPSHMSNSPKYRSSQQKPLLN